MFPVGCLVRIAGLGEIFRTSYSPALVVSHNMCTLSGTPFPNADHIACDRTFAARSKLPSTSSGRQDVLIHHKGSSSNDIPVYVIFDVKENDDMLLQYTHSLTVFFCSKASSPLNHFLHRAACWTESPMSICLMVAPNWLSGLHIVVDIVRISCIACPYSQVSMYRGEFSIVFFWRVPDRLQSVKWKSIRTWWIQEWNTRVCHSNKRQQKMSTYKTKCT